MFCGPKLFFRVSEVGTSYFIPSWKTPTRNSRDSWKADHRAKTYFPKTLYLWVNKAVFIMNASPWSYTDGYHLSFSSLCHGELLYGLTNMFHYPSIHPSCSYPGSWNVNKIDMIYLVKSTKTFVLVPCGMENSCTASPTCFITPAFLPPVFIQAPGTVNWVNIYVCYV